MSVLIKNMEMPKKQVFVILNPNGLVEVLDANNVLLEEYQAIFVPPHGDLIDRDALVRDNGIREIPEYYEVILAAPTILEAEEGET